VRQFALLKELSDCLSRLNDSVNRIRRLRRQLGAFADAVAQTQAGLADKAKGVAGVLLAIESVLVDVKRESPRDVLRQPAGLDDTLVDCINTVAVSDAAPTAQADAVSREVMAKVAGEIDKLDSLVAREIAAINAAAAELRVPHVSG
jgi:hypothetical protein